MNASFQVHYYRIGIPVIVAKHVTQAVTGTTLSKYSFSSIRVKVGEMRLVAGDSCSRTTRF